MASQPAKYSASHVDVATVGCRDDFQVIGALNTVFTILVLDLRSGPVAQSTSLRICAECGGYDADAQ